MIWKKYNALGCEQNFFVTLNFDILKKSYTKCQIFIWKNTTRQILKLKQIQCVRYWIECFSTSQTLKNCLHSKKVTFWILLLRENDSFCIFHALSKAWFWNEIFLLVKFSFKSFTMCLILKEKFLARQILNQIFFIFYNFKFEPCPNTCTFLFLFLHITMNTYRLKYLRHLGISTRHRSNITSSTHFR